MQLYQRSKESEVSGPRRLALCRLQSARLLHVYFSLSDILIKMEKSFFRSNLTYS